MTTAAPSLPDIDARVEPDRLHPAVVVVVVLAALMVITVLVGLWHLRRDTLLAQGRSLASLATASADELDRGIEGVTLAIQATRDDLREGRLIPGQPETTAQLHRRAAILSTVRNLWVLDSQGAVLAASGVSPAPPLTGFVPRPDTLGDEAVAFSDPFVDLSAHEASVALAMRFVGPEGQASGWVLAQMPAASLLGAFPRAALSADARMVVLRSDGVVLAGSLVQDGRAAAREPNALANAAAGGQEHLDDGSRRLVQRRRVEPFGLTLVMTRDLQAGLKNWRARAEVAALGLVSVLAVLSLLLWRMLRAERARRETQRQLQAERDHAALALAAAKEGNWDWDPSTQSFYLSPRMKELLGQPRDAGPRDFTIAVLAQALAPADVRLLADSLQEQAAAVRPQIDIVLRARHADGRWHAIRLRGTAAQDDQGRTLRMAGVAFDVTEERERAAHTRELELRLGHAQKMESLGALAGGLAHDFNNILAAVVGYGEMAQGAAMPGSAQARQLDQVLQAASRGQAVIERILAFSRGGARPRTLFPAQPVAEQVLGLLAPTVDERVRVERRLDAHGLCVRGDATALFEALMNLCNNALQAMPERGVLTVTLERCEFAAEHWTSHGSVAAGAYLRVAVADTGGGIAPELMGRLFEPFFTTRGPTGTGLGLAVVHGVVDDFDGAIDVSSHPGEGSCFTLYLPLAQPDCDPPAPGAEVGSGVPAGQGQTVLVVDDEPTLVRLAEELLAQLGYEPVGCIDPHQALAELRTAADRFDLVITDEVMPGLTGTQLAQRVRELRADLPILLVSGYGGPQLAQRAQDAGILRVLAKPLRVEELARAVAQALRSSVT